MRNERLRMIIRLFPDPLSAFNITISSDTLSFFEIIFYHITKDLPTVNYFDRIKETLIYAFPCTKIVTHMYLGDIQMIIDKKHRLILFWITLAVLLFARVFMFFSVPADINQDEAFAGYNAYTLLHSGKDSFGYSFPMYLTAWGSGMNALESYLSIPFVALFGLHVWVLRIVPLLASMFSLVVVYKLVREFAADDRFALFAMFFTGIMPWHIMLSRWALESNLAPAFLLFGMYFFMRGVKNEKFYILSALFYGLSLYAYATIWIVVPFIILAQIIYLIAKKMIRFSRYTIASAILLFLLALPAMLFLLVNKGVIDEISTPFFSIPRLLYFRGDEISFSDIPANIKNLIKIVITGNDGLYWNSTEEFGIMYKFSIPFTVIGLIAALYPHIKTLNARINNRIATGNKGKKTVKNNKEPAISVTFFMTVQLLAGAVIGALISVNINRVNIIFIPLIYFTAYGVYYIFTHFSFMRERLVFLPLVVYIFCFVQFEIFYFTEYKENINHTFCEGIGDAVEYAKENSDEVSFIYVTPNANYARVLFYARPDVDNYLDTVRYTNYPSAFLDVYAFDRYNFSVDPNSEADGVSCYILDSSYDSTGIVASMAEKGYKSEVFKGFTVYTPN